MGNTFNIPLIKYKDKILSNSIRHAILLGNIVQYTRCDKNYMPLGINLLKKINL